MIGKQVEGGSSKSIYKMALNAVNGEDISENRILDVGGGRGEFSKRLLKRGAKNITLLDYAPSIDNELVQEKQCDLNETWPVPENTYDLVFGLEVIEHLENPRFFFREVRRALKRSGEAFISTPNNESFFSRLNFFLNGEHRYFQDSCYPAHITPITSYDIKRICGELNLKIRKIVYSSVDTIPKVEWKIKGGGKMFSGNFGVLIEKN